VLAVEQAVEVAEVGEDVVLVPVRRFIEAGPRLRQLRPDIRDGTQQLVEAAERAVVVVVYRNPA
jgi:hypothetical protein